MRCKTSAASPRRVTSGGAVACTLDVIPARPRCSTKRTVAFGDVLRAAQETFARVDVPSKLRVLDDVARRGPAPRAAAQSPLPLVA